MTPLPDKQKKSRHRDELPPSMESLWRTLVIGYRAEPRLLLASFAVTTISVLPDALIALWLMVLATGIDEGRRTVVIGAALGLAASAVLNWYLRLVLERLTRRFKDRISIALEAHVARLHATVATIEHQERSDLVDRLAMLRNHVFALDHLFASIFSMFGWLIRLAVTVALLASIHPALVLLILFAIPTVFAATSRPAAERAIEERNAPHDRRARHLFVLGTTAPPGKEVRVAGMGPTLVRQRRSEWERWYAPVSSARMVTAWWNALAWSIFGLGYVGAIVFVAVGLNANAGSVLLVLAAGARLSQYVGAAVGELGFLRGFWLDSGRRLCWLEDYAAAITEQADQPVPERLQRGIHFDHVSFRYPGTERLVLSDVNLDLPAGSVVAIVGENGSGKTTLVKLLCRMYEPTSGRIDIDGVDLARIPTDAWRAKLAGAFQDFFRFEFQAQTTVGLGDEARLADRVAVGAAVTRAGANDVIDRLASGLDTQLGATWDDGVEVSFGQWQKLALARGFMRDEPLVLVLDEPTSALDAETEHALFERYAHESRGGSAPAANGRITILVSHRFSTVRMADHIVVVDGSRIAEVGSHAELMARGGQYSQLYAIQLAGYR
ncbi:MAG: ABC transporter ATP-binding protein [Gemmatimonadaceae bacterium]